MSKTPFSLKNGKIKQKTGILSMATGRGGQGKDKTLGISLCTAL
jgi:hypothetical protein